MMAFLARARFVVGAFAVCTLIVLARLPQPSNEADDRS